MTQPTKRVAEAIRAQMSAQNITQHDVAAALGISQQSVSRRLSGLTGWSVDELVAVADLLGTSPTDLMRAAA